MFANVPLFGFRNLQEGGATGNRPTPLDKGLAKPPMGAPISIYEFSRSGGASPVFTGAAPAHMAVK